MLNNNVKKVLPFPIENLEEPLGDVYLNLDNIRKKIEVSKRNNVTNLTPARLKKLTRMQYKINSSMFFIRTLIKELDTFWIN